MADNTVLPLGTEDGDTYGADDIGGVKFQRIKLIHGADGTNDGDVAAANGLPVSVVPRTSGGLSTHHLVAAATTNATVVKASAGQLFGWFIYNTTSVARKVAFHNTASAPTAGASVFFSLVIPPNSGANVCFDAGIVFSTGIAYTTVTGVADSDNTAVSANDLVINLFYA